LIWLQPNKTTAFVLIVASAHDRRAILQDMDFSSGDDDASTVKGRHAAAADGHVRSAQEETFVGLVDLLQLARQKVLSTKQTIGRTSVANPESLLAKVTEIELVDFRSGGGRRSKITC
jgi:hypothetical protein